MTGIFSVCSLEHAVAGSTGTVFATLFLFPLERVKTLLQIDTSGNKGLADVFRQVLHEEGAGGLYRGCKPMLQTVGSSNFLYFYLFQGLKEPLARAFGREEGVIGSYETLASSAVAGALNMVFTEPLWRASVVAQASHAPAGNAALSASREGPVLVGPSKAGRVERRAPKGVFATVHQLWLEEGARSLWRGLGTSLWLVANPVIQFFAYDFLKALHVKTAEISAVEAFFIGALAKALATVITFPLQVAQSRLRISSSDVGMTKDEIVKFINGVIEPQTETYNLALFSSSGVTTWCPQFQSKLDPKKGLADSLKWLNKNMTAKSCAAQAYPPDWVSVLTKFVAEGVTLPWRIYVCCSRAPEGRTEEVLELIAHLRSTNESPAKGEPLLPLNIVAFDPTIVGNDEEKVFFTEVAGPDGNFLIDTSAEDLTALDKMLKAVQVKRKQLDKLNKKLDKMENLSDRVSEDRALLQMQIALNNMIGNDLELCDWALKNEAEPPPPDI